jgi:hypothetical protein
MSSDADPIVRPSIRKSYYFQFSEYEIVGRKCETVRSFAAAY